MPGQQHKRANREARDANDDEICKLDDAFAAEIAQSLSPHDSGVMLYAYSQLAKGKIYKQTSDFLDFYEAFFEKNKSEHTDNGAISFSSHFKGLRRRHRKLLKKKKKIEVLCYDDDGNLVILSDEEEAAAAD